MLDGTTCAPKRPVERQIVSYELDAYNRLWLYILAFCHRCALSAVQLSRRLIKPVTSQPKSKISIVF